MKYRLFFGILVLFALIIIAGPTMVNAQESASDCAICHSTMVSDFKVPLMTRTTQCSVCHGRAWHAKWKDPVTGISDYATYVPAVGYFKNPYSVNAAVYTLHEAHYGNNDYAGRSDCNACHGVAACSSCHNSVAHIKHSITDFKPLGFYQGDGKTFSYLSVSCTLSQCHQQMPSVKRINVDGGQLCINCHPRFGGSAKDSSGHPQTAINAAHAGQIDAYCTSCHKSELIDEHLSNLTTQKNTLACSTCHNSNDNGVKLAIADEKRNCTACHTQTHNFNITEQKPADIALYPGFEWSAPQPADVWANENWMPAGYQGGKLLISNRRKEVTGPGVWTYYKQNMTANGWTLPATEPNAASNFYTVQFTKGQNKVTIFFYGGENHTATPVASSGYRLEILYK